MGKMAKGFKGEKKAPAYDRAEALASLQRNHAQMAQEAGAAREKLARAHEDYAKAHDSEFGKTRSPSHVFAQQDHEEAARAVRAQDPDAKQKSTRALMHSETLGVTEKHVQATKDAAEAKKKVAYHREESMEHAQTSHRFVLVNNSEKADLHSDARKAHLDAANAWEKGGGSAAEKASAKAEAASSAARSNPAAARPQQVTDMENMHFKMAKAHIAAVGHLDEAAEKQGKSGFSDPARKAHAQAAAAHYNLGVYLRGKNGPSSTKDAKKINAARLDAAEASSEAHNMSPHPETVEANKWGLGHIAKPEGNFSTQTGEKGGIYHLTKTGKKEYEKK